MAHSCNDFWKINPKDHSNRHKSFIMNQNVVIFFQEHIDYLFDFLLLWI
jgi:tRNA A37 threonylcarbamoyladenosine dehydratase